jgi:hypothetical protein
MKLHPALHRAAVLTAIGACITTSGICAASAWAANRSGAGAKRAWAEYIAAPAQFDFALAEVRFGAPVHAARGEASRVAGTMRLAVRGATGLDYVAGGLTRLGALGRPRALVLVVNRRPRGSLAPDLGRIGLTVTVARRLGRPLISQVSNAFSHPRRIAPALCDVPIRGALLTARDLRAVLRRGPALGAFSAAAAVAQAYDVVCRRPYDPAFRQAVTQGSGPCEGPRASPVACCPPNALCLPPPCPPCPCGPGPCPAPLARGRGAALACPLQPIPVVCPL